jgi:hypothetical protein
VLFKPFYFRVLLSTTNVLVHVWSVETIQAVNGLPCLVFEVASRSMHQSNLLSYLVIISAKHLDLIPTEVGCSILELIEPFVEVVPPLFMRSSEIVHSKCDLLHFRAFVHILKVHDFTPPSDSSDNDDHPSSSDSSNDGYPSYDPNRGILRPRPRVSKHGTGSSPTGEPWPFLPIDDGGV